MCEKFCSGEDYRADEQALESVHRILLSHF